MWPPQAVYCTRHNHTTTPTNYTIFNRRNRADTENDYPNEWKEFEKITILNSIHAHVVRWLETLSAAQHKLDLEQIQFDRRTVKFNPLRFVSECVVEKPHLSLVHSITAMALTSALRLENFNIKPTEFIETAKFGFSVWWTLGFGRQQIEWIIELRMLPVPNEFIGGQRRSSCRSGIGRRTSALLPLNDPFRQIIEINNQIATFRDILIQVGQARDCPELRERIRKVRRSGVDACKILSAKVLLQLKTSITAEGILTDNPHLVLLFYLAQLLLRELIKSYRLIQVVPMDMAGYYENRAGPSNLGNVMSQIILCKQITPDFNQEELCSITKDSQDIAKILSDLQEFMPKQEDFLEQLGALKDSYRDQLAAKQRRNTLYNSMSLLCCISQSGEFQTDNETNIIKRTLERSEVVAEAGMVTAIDLGDAQQQQQQQQEQQHQQQHQQQIRPPNEEPNEANEPATAATQQQPTHFDK